MLSLVTLRMVSDAQFEKMGVAIGHAAKIRSVLAEKNSGSLAGMCIQSFDLTLSLIGLIPTCIDRKGLRLN